MNKYIPIIPPLRLKEIIRGFVASRSDAQTRPDMNNEHNLIDLCNLVVAEAQARLPLWKLECGKPLGPATPEDQAIYNAIAANYEQEAKPVKVQELGSEWVSCMKLPVVVHVRNQREGEKHVSTREGITPVMPDDLIMRGVSGEEYPIGKAIFDQTYTFDIAPPTEAAIRNKALEDAIAVIEAKQRTLSCPSIDHDMDYIDCINSIRAMKEQK